MTDYDANEIAEEAEAMKAIKIKADNAAARKSAAGLELCQCCLCCC
jgi:hypothetical protein